MTTCEQATDMKPRRQKHSKEDSKAAELARSRSRSRDERKDRNSAALIDAKLNSVGKTIEKSQPLRSDDVTRSSTEGSHAGDTKKEQIVASAAEKPRRGRQQYFAPPSDAPVKFSLSQKPKRAEIDGRLLDDYGDGDEQSNFDVPEGGESALHGGSTVADSTIADSVFNTKVIDANGSTGCEPNGQVLQKCSGSAVSPAVLINPSQINSDSLVGDTAEVETESATHSKPADGKHSLHSRCKRSSRSTEAKQMETESATDIDCDNPDSKRNILRSPEADHRADQPMLLPDIKSASSRITPSLAVESEQTNTGPVTTAYLAASSTEAPVNAPDASSATADESKPAKADPNPVKKNHRSHRSRRHRHATGDAENDSGSVAPSATSPSGRSYPQCNRSDSSPPSKRERHTSPSRSRRTDQTASIPLRRRRRRRGGRGAARRRRQREQLERQLERERLAERDPGRDRDRDRSLGLKSGSLTESQRAAIFQQFDALRRHRRRSRSRSHSRSGRRSPSASRRRTSGRSRHRRRSRSSSSSSDSTSRSRSRTRSSSRSTSSSRSRSRSQRRSQARSRRQNRRSRTRSRSRRNRRSRSRSNSQRRRGGRQHDADYGSRRTVAIDKCRSNDLVSYKDYLDLPRNRSKSCIAGSCADSLNCSRCSVERQSDGIQSDAHWHEIGHHELQCLGHAQSKFSGQVLHQFVNSAFLTNVVSYATLHYDRLNSMTSMKSASNDYEVADAINLSAPILGNDVVDNDMESTADSGISSEDTSLTPTSNIDGAALIMICRTAANSGQAVAPRKRSLDLINHLYPVDY